MATIRTAIQITDGMSPAFRSMNTAMNIVLSSFEALQRASGNAIDTHSIQAARTELARAETSFNQIEQQIREANQAQQQFNNSMQQGHSHAGGMWSMIKSMTAGMLLSSAIMAGMQAVGNGFKAADNYINQNARISLINDGLQSQAQLQDKIYQAAQKSKGVYGEMVDTVAKLGLLAKDAFKGNDETIAFAELMNKSFKISGASASEATNSMYQLTQAMAAGRLQGDEFRSIMENAPMLAQAIAKYAGKSMGELREMSKDGEISATMIKNALFSAADDINKKFETMPMTFGSVWNSIRNKAIMEFSTIIQKVNDFINSDVGASAITNISNAIAVFASTLGVIIDGIIAVSTFFNNNWSMIAPLIWGVIAALIVYNAVMGIAWLTTLKDLAVKAAHTIASWAETAAIIALTFAQEGLNAALALCPLTWIIIGVIALIAVFYAVIGAINKFAGTSISATGVIAGVFMTAAAFIGNVVIAAINVIIDAFAVMWNFIASFAEFFANVFNDPVGSIVRLFASMADSVLGILEGIASAVDTLFHSNLAGAVSGWRSTLQGMVTDLVGDAKIKVERIDPSSMHLDRFNYGDAYKTGYDFGKGIEEKFDISKILGGKDLGDYGDQAKFAADTAANTGSMKDSMDASKEDLKYLRDMAEQEVVNRFTTAQVKVDVTNHNNINSDMDIDGVISHFGKALEETIETVAEGVHK